MRKNKLAKILRNDFNFNISKIGKNDYNISSKNKVYNLKVLPITANHQLTINSNTIWESKRGIVKGIRFIAVDSNLIKMTDFVGLENKIVFLTNKPYKILKAVNESDLNDISEINFVNDIFITSDTEQLIQYINENSWKIRVFLLINVFKYLKN